MTPSEQAAIFARNRAAAQAAIASGRVLPEQSWAPVAHLYRGTDPATSGQAAARVASSGSRDDHIGRVIHAVRAHPGRTSAEIAQITGLERHEAARRTADAEHLGRIRKGTPRICSVGGTRAVTWWAVPTTSQWSCLYGDAA